MEKKAHTVKNNLIAGLDDRDIKYLGKTRSGKVHDKRIADEEQAQVPDGYEVYQDSGFLGYKMGEGITLFEPKKKPRGGELTREEKRRNQIISRTRVVVEHVISGVKRCRCVKDIFRNWKDDFDDLVMELACGLHNFRNASRVGNY